MQAAFISYAVFLALLLLLVFVVFIVIAVRSLLGFIRGRSDQHNAVSSKQPPPL